MLLALAFQNFLPIKNLEAVIEESAGQRYVVGIRQSGLSIYDDVTDVGGRNLLIPIPELNEVLNAALVGTTLAGLALRTRSKIVKTHICKALGYPMPSTFKKYSPEFQDKTSISTFKSQTTCKSGMRILTKIAAM